MMPREEGLNRGELSLLSVLQGLTGRNSRRWRATKSPAIPVEAVWVALPLPVRIFSKLDPKYFWVPEKNHCLFPHRTRTFLCYCEASSEVLSRFLELEIVSIGLWDYLHCSP